MHDATHYDLSALRLLTNAAAPLPEAHVAQLPQAFPQARLYLMYGLTECKRASYLPPEQLDARPGSVGRGMPIRSTGWSMTSGIACRTVPPASWWCAVST